MAGLLLLLAVVHPIISLRASHLVGDHCLDFGVTAVAAACSLCQDHVFPLCPDFGSAPRAQAVREHRWRHIEHLQFECQCIPGPDGSVALALLRDYLFRVCSGSDHEEAVSTAVCTRRPADACVLARFSLPAWSSVRAWLLRLHTVFDFALPHLPAPDPVLHVSAPVRRGTVADARLGLA